MRKRGTISVGMIPSPNFSPTVVPCVSAAEAVIF